VAAAPLGHTLRNARDPSGAAVAAWHQRKNATANLERLAAARGMETGADPVVDLLLAGEVGFELDPLDRRVRLPLLVEVAVAGFAAAGSLRDETHEPEAFTEVHRPP